MKKAGFTLIEMLVTISILAIVLMIGVPSFNELMRSSAIRTNSSEMVTAFNYARLEAVKRGAFVEVARQDGASWTGGLVVWVDDDGDDTMDSGEALRLWGEFKSGSTVSSAVSSFVFDPSGEVDNADVLTLCDGRTEETGRTIYVLASGAVYAEKVGCE